MRTPVRISNETYPKSRGNRQRAKWRNATSPERMSATTRVLLVDPDPALQGLLEEWLAADGCTVEATHSGANGGRDGFDLIMVDIPAPRQGRAEGVMAIAEAHPGTPILALSSSFFPGVDTTGPVARALGVAGVLPKPVTRSGLLDALRRLLPYSLR
jgi:CheY-like chemotaxis protein